MYLRVELLDHVVILYLTFGGTDGLFATVAEPFTLLPAVYKGSNFSTSPLSFCDGVKCVTLLLQGKESEETVSDSENGQSWPPVQACYIPIPSGRPLRPSIGLQSSSGLGSRMGTSLWAPRIGLSIQHGLASGFLEASSFWKPW